MKKLRIVHAYDGHERVLPGQGSVPSIVFTLAKCVSTLGHHVTVLERQWSPDSPLEEEIDGVRFHRVRSRPLASVPYTEFKRGLPGIARLVLDRTLLAWRFRRYLNESHFDVVHVHTPLAASVLVALDRDLGRRMVYTGHLGEERKRLRLGGAKEVPLPLKLFSPDLFLIKRVAKVILLNEGLKSALVSRGLIPEANVAVIPGLVAPSTTASRGERTEAPCTWLVGSGEVVVLFGGTITPRKGVLTLIEAARILVHQLGRKEVLFALAGDTTLDRRFAATVEAAVKRGSLERHVRLLGFMAHEKYVSLLKACDIFVLPSFEEGDPIALREALSQGKPLVASNVGGIPRQVRDGWNGFLVPPGDSQLLARALDRLIGDSDLRKSMSQRSRLLATEIFDPLAIAHEYVKIYGAVVEP